MGLLIKEVSLLRNTPNPWDVLIEDGIITAIDSQLNTGRHKLIKGEGMLLVPGFFDLHTHLREPGFSEKETIASGTLAAAKGGYTTICTMPNTDPAPDCPENFRMIQELIEAERVIPVRIIAAATLNRAGCIPVKAADLKALGAVALSDDGSGIQDLEVLEEVFLASNQAALPYFSHCEDSRLAQGGVFHDTFSGLAEVVALQRELALVRQIGLQYHLCHLSASESRDLVAQAKAERLPVTAEATPHHLTLAYEEIAKTSLYKVNPPLRSKKDRRALVEGLKTGIIDCIATDHAPHTKNDKAKPPEKAPFGISGIELTFPLLYSKLVLPGYLSLPRLLEALIIGPRKILREPLMPLSLTPGVRADLTLIDLDQTREVREEELLSKGKNTPFIGERLKGWPVLTLVNGQVIWHWEVVS